MISIILMCQVESMRQDIVFVLCAFLFPSPTPFFVMVLILIQLSPRLALLAIVNNIFCRAEKSL